MQADKLRELLVDLAADSRAPRLAGVLEIRCANFIRDNGPELLAIAEASEADRVRLDWIAMNGQGVRKVNSGNRNLIVWDELYPTRTDCKRNLRAAIDAARGRLPCADGEG